MAMDAKQIASTLNRVKLFEGLTTDQINQVLKISSKKKYSQGQTVFSRGDESTEILLVISGLFEVQNAGGPVSVVKESEIVGEMGVITEQFRSADVVSIRDSVAISIPRNELFKLINSDVNFGFIFYRNLTHIVCDYLRNNNIVLEFSNLLG